jgi:hypothetical protein
MIFTNTSIDDCVIAVTPMRRSKVGKKKRLMDIRRPRHEEFDAQLRRRFKGQTGIEPKVNEIEKQGICDRSIVLQGKGQ